MKKCFLAALAAASALVPAAAEGPADPRIGPQVDRICFSRNINDFRTIEGEDDAILLATGVSRWYKTTLTGACSYSQLRSAQSVVIDQRPAGGCVTPGDSLIFSDSAFGDFSFPNATRCVISEIFEWDPESGKAEDAAAAGNVPGR